MSNKKLELLVVEDNEGDVILLEIALNQTKMDFNLNVVEDGYSAVKYLRRQDEYEEAPTPDLILLDINMPGMNGQEVLEIIKTDRYLKIIPTIILSSSHTKMDIIESYANHANCYIIKPTFIEDLIQVAQKIEAFWTGIVNLPTAETIDEKPPII